MPSYFLRQKNVLDKDYWASCSLSLFLATLLIRSKLTWRPSALRKRVSNISLVADTNGNMVSNSAVGIDAAEARTRVLAFSVDAGLVRRTVRVDDTLRAAVWRRANHLRQAGAAALAANVPRRVAVGPTRVGHTRVLHDDWLNSCKSRCITQMKIR